MSIGRPVACQHEGLWREDIDAWDVSAPRVRAAAIMMTVAVPAALAWVNPMAAKYCWVLIPIVQWAAEYWPAPPRGRPGTFGRYAAINDPFTTGVQPPARLICLPGTAQPTRRRGPGKLQAARPPEH